MTAHCRSLAAVALVLVCTAPGFAQNLPPADTRTQYPAFLRDSFFSVGVGGIDYEFSSAQLAAGDHAASVGTPHPAARIGLFGHAFNRYLAASASYMRPASFVAYNDVNGDGAVHHVWMALGAVTLQGRLPVTRRFDAYGEGGLGIVSRHGFSLPQAAAVPDVHYATAVFGGGIAYHATRAWDLVGGVLVAPGRAAYAQSPSIVTSAGFQYTMHPLPADRVAANAHSGFRFPATVVQIETSAAYGYGVNHFFSKSVFWDGNVRVDRGEAIHVARNVFHTRRVFAFDLGASAGVWRSQAQQSGFYTLSLYPQFRFTFLHTTPADLWAVYSLAGPTYISRDVIDGHAMGTRFTFQDFMGVGAFVGSARRMTVGVKINHYSNGNMFTQNSAVTVPLTLTLGYAF